jgi:Uma2 family endonuclease
MHTDILTTHSITDDPRPRRWTRDEYHRMAEQGFFDGQRVELIEGEIAVMSPQTRAHVASAHLVGEALRSAIGPGFWIRYHAPLALSEVSEPEPDISVVPGGIRDYHDHPTNALLAVEVSDSTLRHDLNRKARLYAAARGIPEYWVVNLIARQLVVMLDPKSDGYQTIATLSESDTVQPKFLPSKPIAVKDLLP